MRILFVSGTTVGGSGRSQRELATRLANRGHVVRFVVDHERPAFARQVYEQLSDLSARVGNAPGSGFIRWLEVLPGRRVSVVELDDIEHMMTSVPENAAEPMLDTFHPDVVIGSSLLRLTWRRVVRAARDRGIATVLYVREVEALNHFEPGGETGDLVVANAESLARRVEALGYRCPVFPSVIDVGVTRVESSREKALVINPIASRGIETIWSIAARLPDVEFVLQESWPLDDENLATIRRNLAMLPNVELRRAEPPGPQLYRDARVLLVPYRVDNRPRVIAEAQANGIPVIVADSPALVEAAAMGGIVADVDDIDGWCDAIQLLWSDVERYDRLSLDALAYSARDDIDPNAVTERFDAFLRGVMESHVDHR